MKGSPGEFRGIAQDDVDITYDSKYVKCFVCRQTITVMWRDQDEGLSDMCVNDFHLEKFTEQLV